MVFIGIQLLSGKTTQKGSFEKPYLDSVLMVSTLVIKPDLFENQLFSLSMKFLLDGTCFSTKLVGETTNISNLLLFAFICWRFKIFQFWLIPQSLTNCIFVFLWSCQSDQKQKNSCFSAVKNHPTNQFGLVLNRLSITKLIPQ